MPRKKAEVKVDEEKSVDPETVESPEKVDDEIELTDGEEIFEETFSELSCNKGGDDDE